MLREVKRYGIGSGGVDLTIFWCMGGDIFRSFLAYGWGYPSSGECGIFESCKVQWFSGKKLRSR